MNNPAYPLLDLFWECTLRCNAYCAFCGSRCGDVSSTELTTQEILAAFRDVAAAFDPTQIMINVTGGEPLLRKDLFEVMAECTQMGFSWGMVTNGMLLTPEIVEKLKAAGMKTVSVSLDGLEETHEALRGVKGSFPKVINGIKLLRQADFLEHVQVTTVVSKQNIGQLEDLYALLKPMGLHSWRVAIVDPIGRAQDQEDLLLGKDELQHYLDFIASHREDPVLPVITTCSHFLGGQDKSLGRDHFVCRTGKSVASILANGDIFVCPNVPRRPELIQGNVRRDSLAEVWRTGFRYFRDPNARRGSDCTNCPDWTSCWGDSAHTWDFDRQEPNFCYRRFFPDNRQSGLPALAAILPRLKATTRQLQGIRIRYGWENSLPVVFTPNAARELFHFFHWGQRHPQNLSELLAALIGHRLSDAVLVEFVSPAYLEMRNTKEAMFSETSLRSGLTEADAINMTYPHCEDLRLVNSPCTLLGFIHSHPDDLELFLSEPDVNLHGLLVKGGQELSMIVNPQKRQLAAYWGEDMALAEIQLLMSKEEVSQWDFPDVTG